jgi:hypothetical protein
MTTTDPLLKKLVADATVAEASIPLDRYLPSGKLFGYTAPHEDFCRVATNQLGQESGYTGDLAPAPDPEYVHLAAPSRTMPGQDDSSKVVRVRLADVVAWTVG